MQLLLPLVAICLSALIARATDGDVCTDWFARSGLAAKSKDCVLRCDILPKDMSTFPCSDRCDEFRKPQKCKPDPYWIENGSFSRPGKFVSSRAKDSVEEDFAENTDAYLFEPTA